MSATNRLYAFFKISKPLYIFTDLFSIKSENLNSAGTYRIIIIKLPTDKNGSVYREITVQMTVNYIIFFFFPFYVPQSSSCDVSTPCGAAMAVHPVSAASVSSYF